MKRKGVMLAALGAVASMALAAGQSSAGAPATIAPADSASVATATVLSRMMKDQIDMFRSRGIEISDPVFIDAFVKGFAGQPTGMSVDQADAYMTARFRALEGASRPKVDLAAQKAFVDSMSVAEGAVVTPSGLVFQVISEGEGASPVDTDVVMVEYTGRLSDGTVFDGSRGEVVEFPVNALIPGFTEGLKMMKPGGEYRLIIPSSLGYGPGGAGPIPGDAVLDFTVKLEGVKAK